MIEIIEGFYDVHCSHIVKCNGKFYYIDSCDTPDQGLETMVFECDRYGKHINWNDVYVENYSDVTEMLNRHIYIINHLEEFLKEEENND